MINLTTDARLNIILPNMNKALGEAIKNATPEQLESLKEGKDIKSLLTSVFQDKITSAKSDAVLGDILKNSSAFKNMGNLSDNLTSLLKELKTSADFTAKSGGLENFLKNISTLDSQTLKTQIHNSGVFMESKLAAVVQKIPDLIQTLDQLKATLGKNLSNDSKALQEKITTLLSNPQIQTASQKSESATLLADAIKDIRNSLQSLSSKSDPLYSKEVSALASQLDQHTTILELKTSLSQLYGSLLRSNSSETNTLLDSIEKLLKNLSPNTTQEIKEFTQSLKTAIVDGDISKSVPKLLSTLSEFTDPLNILDETSLQKSMKHDLKANLLTLADELKNSSDATAPQLLDHVDKLLTQIDYHQLTSYLNGSNSLYIPFSWDQLQEGSLAFKKTSDKKFYCQIDLQLKEYGELNLMMGLYEENQLEIRVHTEKNELKTLIHDHISELRGAFIDAGLNLRSIRVSHIDETNSDHLYESNDFGVDNGFEVKV